MSHIHIPDGVLAPWLWILGYVLLIILYLIINKLAGKTNTKKIPFIGVFGALMLLSMSIPLPFPVPYHLNLSVLAGIILGPVYSFFTILTVNIILAFISHGGITVIGLNTAVIFSEALCGYYLYRFLSAKTSKIFISGFVATLISLMISTVFSIVIVYAGTHNFEYLQHHHHHGSHHENEEEMQSPPSEADFHGMANLKVPPDRHDINHPPIPQNMDEAPPPERHNDFHHHMNEEHFNIKKFFILMLIFGSVGWTLEGLITAFIVSYINKVKPEVL